MRDIRKELTKEAVKLNSHISKLAPLADPTGVALSVTTLRNLRRLRSDEDFEKIDPTYLDYDIFMEVLGIDSNTALQLRDFFWGNAVEKLSNVEGITKEVMEKIKKSFVLHEKEGKSYD